MGLLDKIFRRGKKKVEVEEWRYILKRRNDKTGGMEKAMELAGPQTVEELYPHLEPGVYALHRYRKGKTGFDSVWGPVQVEGEVAEERKTASRTTSGLGALGQMLHDIQAIQKEGKEAYETLGLLFGDRSPTTDDIVDKWAELADKKKKLDIIFPSASTKSEEIPISGSIPALAVYAPTIVDRSLDAVEKRMARWGFLSKEGSGVPDLGKGNLIELPEKPKAPAVEEEKEDSIIEKPPIPRVEEKKEKEEKVETEVIEDESGTGK